MHEHIVAAIVQAGERSSRKCDNSIRADLTRSALARDTQLSRLTTPTMGWHDPPMELDSKQLGRLRQVADPRDVWSTEAGDFTPWLAENIDELANELGIPLTVVGTEVPVGDFRLDIRAETDGRVVIIENQLGKTDHGHLGQCLVYAAGLDAAAVIWVAPHFREDYRQTFDWLNERTDVGVGFFGVEVSVVQIGDGPRAPVFKVVSRPNNWQKVAKAAGSEEQLATASVSALNAARQDFFAEVLTEVNAELPAIRVPARSRTNWIALSSGARYLRSRFSR